MTAHQTNAQRLADVLDHFGASGSASKEAATELRRLSAIEQERDQLRGEADQFRALAKANAEIKALKDGQADPVGTVFTMEALGTPGRPFCHVQLSRQLPTGTKIYTAPPNPTAKRRCGATSD